MSLMQHRGYSARVEFDDEDGVFFGRIAGIADGVTFHATTVDGLRAAFREAVDDYVTTCAMMGKAPQKAFSGKLMLRVDPAVHANAVLAAELAGKSLNQWGQEVIAKAANAKRPADDEQAA